MHEQLDTLAAVFEWSPTNPLVFLVSYGSRRPDSDIDMLIVYEDAPVRADVVVGRLDALVLGRSQFEALLDAFDPFVTEPLLTGDLLRGDESEWKSCQSRIRDTVPDRPVAFRLLSRAATFLEASEAMLAISGPTRSQYAAGLRNMAFAVSYSAYARRYLDERVTCTLWELENEVELLHQIRNQKPSSAEPQCIEQLLDATRALVFGEKRRQDP